MSRRADYRKLVGTATKLVEAGVIEEPKWLEAVRRRVPSASPWAVHPARCDDPCSYSDCTTLYTTPRRGPDDPEPQ